MTLIISAATHDFIVQVSDRRLTLGNDVKSETANKGAVAITDGKRYVSSFTGLTQAPGFNCIKLLRDCAHEFLSFETSARNLAAYADHITTRFQGRFANSAWLKRNASSDTGALYIFVSAFDENGRATYGLVANRSTLGLSDLVFGPHEFRSVVTFHPGVLIIGQYQSVDAADWNALQKLVDAQTSPDELLGKSVEIMRKSATPGNVSIGRNLSSIIAARDPTLDVQFGYFADEPSNTIYLANQTVQTPDGPASFFDIQITDPNQPSFSQGHPNGKGGNPGGWQVEIKKIS